ncbi:MAG: carboxypeptidase regulatory-like domain-containing protein [Planctomycetes bacterium]|nr:carboxypeptidase regulatory-like domain-containing protein [Planctomycetota bacterium]
MNHSRLLLLLLLAVLMGGLAAWFVLDPAASGALRSGDSGGPDSAKIRAAAADDPATDEPENSPARAGANRASTGPEPEIIRADQPPPRQSGEPGRDPGGTGSAPAQPQGGTTGQSEPNPPRTLTARERLELERQQTGRVAHNSRVTSAPENGISSTKGLVKSLAAGEWPKQFAEEGLEPPEMVPTQVAGKVMSPLSNEGIANAKVTLLSFLPWGTQAGGPLYVVGTELSANAKGEFAGTIPVGPRQPQFHASVGMIVEAAGEVGGDFRVFQVVAGLALNNLRPGEFNQLGIFWAPEQPFDVDCDATQFSETGLKVICTGELDPQRWHSSKRTEALALFAATGVAPRDGATPEAAANAGRCTVRSTWDGKDRPYLTLCQGLKPLVTRRCITRKAESSASTPEQVPKPFETVLFENTGYVSITGQCMDADGAPVAGAVIVSAGDTTYVTAVSDASGWFELANPGKNTRHLMGTHDDFINTLVSNVKPGDVGVQVKFQNRKPVLWLRLRDRYTQAAITQVSIKAIEKSLPPEGGGKAPKPATQTFDLTSSTGEFVQKAEWLVNAIVIEKVGYFPRTINDPISLQAQAGGPLDIDLYPGRELNVKPRQFTAVQDATRWFPDSKPEDPGIYTAWSNHWIEWQVDFGPEPEPGVEGGSFDLLLGCTNQGLVDNDYRFEVEVWIDGVKKGQLSILANSTAVQTGRMKLGKLAGAHTVRLVWLNDKWIPDQLDANIRYASLQFLEQP